MRCVSWSSLSNPFLGWSFDSFAFIPTMISCCYFCKAFIKLAKSIIILSHISVSSRLCSSSRCNCCIMFIDGPAFIVEDWQVRYADVIVLLLLYLPMIEMYNHLPSPRGSLPDLLMPELNGWRVIIAVPPGLYKSLYSISVSEFVIWECLQCRLLVALRDSSPWGCCQWVFILTKKAISISYCPMLSHISSNVWQLEDNSKLFIFWKRIRVWLFSFRMVMRSPNGRLLYLSYFEHRNESSFRYESY